MGIAGSAHPNVNLSCSTLFCPELGARLEKKWPPKQPTNARQVHAMPIRLDRSRREPVVFLESVFLVFREISQNCEKIKVSVDSMDKGPHRCRRPRRLCQELVMLEAVPRDLGDAPTRGGVKHVRDIAQFSGSFMWD